MTHVFRISALTAAVATLGLLLVCGCSEPAPRTLMEQATDAFSAQHFDAAIQACNGVIRENPQNSAGYLLRGRAFHCLNEYDRAIADFTTVIELKPTDPEAYFHRADAYKDSGRAKLAAADAQQARELDPSYQRALGMAGSAKNRSESSLRQALDHEANTRSREPNTDTDPWNITGQKESTDDAGLAKERRSTDRDPKPAATMFPPMEQTTSASVAHGSDYGQARSTTEELLGLEIPSGADLNNSQVFRPEEKTRQPKRRSPPPELAEDLEDAVPLGEDDDNPQGRRRQPVRPVVERPLHPFGAAPMRATGVSTFSADDFDEEEADLGPRGASAGGLAGGAPASGSAAGASSGSPTATARASGRGRRSRSFAGNGYNANPNGTGPVNLNPYGGGINPYGATPGTAGPGSAPVRSPYGAPAAGGGAFAPEPGTNPSYVPVVPGLRED